MSNDTNNHKSDMSKASTSIKEQLSAFADGELEQDTSKFLQRRLQNDTALANTWSRYHLIGDVMRNQAGDTAVAPQDFSSSVMSAITNEPQETYQAPPATSMAAPSANNTAAANQGWFKQRAANGWGALAAVVAVVAVGAAFVLPELSVDQTAQPQNVAQTAAPINNATTLASDSNTTLIRPTGGAVGVQASVDTDGQTVGRATNANSPRLLDDMPSYLNDIVLQHNERSQANQRQGLLPYVRLLNTDEQDQNKQF